MRLPGRLVLMVVIAVCAALAVSWVRARSQANALAAKLAQIGPVATTPAQPDATLTRPLPSSDSSEERELRAALLAEARQIPEVSRWESALRVIRRIKAQHEAAPPPRSRSLRPPTGPNGSIFPELMSDPEYAQLVAEYMRETARAIESYKWNRLEIPEEMRREIADIHAEAQLALLDARDIISREADSPTARTFQEILQEREQRVRTLVGEDLWSQYNSNELSSRTSAESTVASLATRLSYTAAPLGERETAQLSDLMVTLSGDNLPAYEVFYTTELLDQARTILSPAQLEGLQQLHAEREARTLRYRLPPTSQLPRTIRRARQESK